VGSIPAGRTIRPAACRSEETRRPLRSAGATQTYRDASDVLDPNTTALITQLGLDAGLMEALMSGAIWISVLTLVTAIPTGMIARRKGRSKTLWILFALSLPVIPLLLIWFLPALPSKRPPAKD